MIDALEDVSESGLDFFAYAGHGGKTRFPFMRIEDIEAELTSV